MIWNSLNSRVQSDLKVILYQHVPRLPASPSLITFQFQSLVVLLSDIEKERVFMACLLFIWHVNRLIRISRENKKNFELNFHLLNNLYMNMFAIFSIIIRIISAINV